jgi:uncharacterized protein (TIRG00374 family)
MTVIFLKLQRAGDLEKLRSALAEAAGRWPLLCIGVLGFLLCLLFCVERWNILLKAQGLFLPFRKLLALTCVGQFFNAFMFGATGGDVVKAYYVATETHHRRAEVIATVFIDRIMGLFAMILLTGVVALLRMPFFLSSHPMRVALVIIAIQFLGGAAMIILVLCKALFEKWDFFRRLEAQTALGRVLGRAYGAFHYCMRDPRLLLKTMILSVLNHIAFIVCVFYIGMALGIEMRFWDYLTVFPVINLVAAVPVTPGGLGTRESMALYLLAQFGVGAAHAVTLALLMYVTLLFWSLMGGIVYFFYIVRRGRTPPPEITDESESELEPEFAVPPPGGECDV